MLWKLRSKQRLSRSDKERVNLQDPFVDFVDERRCQSGTTTKPNPLTVSWWSPIQVCIRRETRRSTAFQLPALGLLRYSKVA